MRVALATCLELPEPDPDQDLMIDRFSAHGVDAQLVAWDDPAQELNVFDACVLRSTWDYYHNPDEFMRWVRQASRETTLLNPPEIIKWNIDKNYLREIRDVGNPIVPTEWCRQGTMAEVADIMGRNGWDEVVIKPTISAGSFLTRRFNQDSVEVAQRYLDAMLAERSALVQRYMPSVESRGERSLMWIDGEFTHAVQKEPRFADGVERVSEGLDVSDEEQAFGMAVIRKCADRILYGRVDVIHDDDGEMMLSELELMEPSLFFLQRPESLDRFIDAIKQRVAAAQH